MRSIIVFAALATQLFLANAGWADAYEDCRQTCETDKEERDIDCPSPYDSTPEGQERAQCLSASRDAYERCLAACTLPPPPPSSESPTSPSMNY